MRLSFWFGNLLLLNPGQRPGLTAGELHSATAGLNGPLATSNKVRISDSPSLRDIGMFFWNYQKMGTAGYGFQQPPCQPTKHWSKEAINQASNYAIIRVANQATKQGSNQGTKQSSNKRSSKQQVKQLAVKEASKHGSMQPSNQATNKATKLSAQSPKAKICLDVCKCLYLIDIYIYIKGAGPIFV